MNKRAQFYLIAALIIVTIIASLTALINFAKSPKEDSSLYDLLREINFESSQIIDHGVLKGLPQNQIEGQINEILTYYAHSNPQLTLFSIFANATFLNISFYQKNELNSSSFQLLSSFTNPVYFNTASSGNVSYDSQQNIVELNLNDDRHRFKLQQGYNIFIIIKKQNKGGTFVSRS